MVVVVVVVVWVGGDVCVGMGDLWLLVWDMGGGSGGRGGDVWL